MNYKETIIKKENIKIKPLPVKWVDDGKVDIIMTIPLTAFLDAQAKQAFFAGAKDMFEFFVETIAKNKIPSEEDMKAKLREMGMDLSPTKEGEVQ